MGRNESNQTNKTKANPVYLSLEDSAKTVNMVNKYSRYITIIIVKVKLNA